MDIADFELLREVADAGSFAAVARARQIDPSLISRSVSRIEEELGVRVFERSTRALALTESGSAFMDSAGDIPRLFEQARDAALGLSQSITGTLRLTASHGFMQLRIVPLMGKLAAKYPNLRISLIASDAVLDLRADAIDLAIRLGPGVTGDLVAARLFDVRYRVVASPEWVARHGAIKPADLSEIDCLVFPLSGFRNAWQLKDRQGQVSEIEVSSRIEAADATALRQMTLDGLGPSLMADWCVAEDLRAGALIDLFPEMETTARDFYSAAWLVYPSRAYLPAKTRAAADFFRRQFSNAT